MMTGGRRWSSRQRRRGSTGLRDWGLEVGEDMEGSGEDFTTEDTEVTEGRRGIDMVILRLLFVIEVL